MRFRECWLISKVIDHGRGSRPEKLVQLHELGKFEEVLEFEQPRLLLHGKDYFHAIFYAMFLGSICAEDLVNMLATHDTHLCD